MRLVFLGSPPFATPVLERLLASPLRPALVVTPPARPRGRGRKLEPSEVADRAARAGVPVERPPSARDPALIERLRALEADVFLVASYGELLRRELLDLPRDVCLNVHPSLLPRHRGATPVPAAILAGDEVTGTTIQRVVLELDAGDVLVQEATPIRPGETAGELLARLAVLSGDVALAGLEAIERGEAVYTPQDAARVTTCKRLTKEDGLVDWTRDAAYLERHVRAMNPWPAARTVLPPSAGSKPLTVWRARVAAAPDAARARDAAPGEVLEAGERFVVATGAGALVLDLLQVAGKRALPAAELLRGVRLGAGERLG